LFFTLDALLQAFGEYRAHKSPAFISARKFQDFGFGSFLILTLEEVIIRKYLDIEEEA
jgi:hypothetical protein